MLPMFNLQMHPSVILLVMGLLLQDSHRHRSHTMWTLDAGTTEIPVVSAVTNDDNAVVTVTDATNLAGTEAERTSTVLITAEDGVTTKTYVVIFSLSVGIDDKLIEGFIEIYPVPAHSTLYLKMWDP